MRRRRSPRRWTGRTGRAYATILLDRKLPDGTAADLLPRLRRLAPASAVIVVTGLADVDGAIEALRQGAADYLLKPIDPDELRARIGRIAEHRRLEEAHRESERFARSVLDSLDAHIAVLDHSGTILAVNQAWRGFAAANGAGGANVAEGADYLQTCARATGEDADTARAFASGIHDVLAGRREILRAGVPVPRSRPAPLVRRAGDSLPGGRLSQGGRRARGHHRAEARRRGPAADRAAIPPAGAELLGYHHRAEPPTGPSSIRARRSSECSATGPRTASARNIFLDRDRPPGGPGQEAGLPGRGATTARRIGGGRVPAPARRWDMADIEAVGQNLLSDPSVGAIIANYRDITERKEAEERALQSERLAAIGEMVAGLAHESRNALQRGQACLEMLALEVGDRPRAMELVGRQQQAQDDLHRLYEEVRDYAAPIQLEPRSCDLPSLWRLAWDGPGAGRGPPGGRTPRGDRGARTSAAWSIRSGWARSSATSWRTPWPRAPTRSRSPSGARRATWTGGPPCAWPCSDNGPGLDPEQHDEGLRAVLHDQDERDRPGAGDRRRIIEAHGGRIDSRRCPARGRRVRHHLAEGGNA